jgi:hypothetical protein
MTDELRGLKGERGIHGDEGPQGERGEKGAPGNNVSRRNQWIGISLLLAPPWALFLVLCYWAFIDTDPPLVLVYQSEMFSSIRPDGRDEARRNAISEVEGGTDVYIWREICVTRGTIGDARPLWLGAEFVWSPPQRTSALLPGCYGRSYQVDTPVVRETKTYTYHHSIAYRINPMTVVDVTYPPMALVIRGTKQ